MVSLAVNASLLGSLSTEASYPRGKPGSRSHHQTCDKPAVAASPDSLPGHSAEEEQIVWPVEPLDRWEGTPAAMGTYIHCTPMSTAGSTF